MRLATLRDGSRDGALIVVHPDGAHFGAAASVAPHLQAALDRWDEVAPKLRRLSAALAAGDVPAAPLDPAALAAPLPRAYEWIDGSAYINHVVLVRRARGADPPATLETDPLVYQGGSGVLLGPRDPIVLLDEDTGPDLEAEVCVVLGDTPQGRTPEEADAYVRLLMVANDITHRALIPPELAKGFGFFQSKPATAFAPFAVTPDELGDAYHGGRVHLTMRVLLNGAQIGEVEAGPEDALLFS